MKVVLIVVDMQGAFKGMAEEMNIIDKLVKVIDVFHKKGLPVFFTQHTDVGLTTTVAKWWNDPILKDTERWKLIPEIEKCIDRSKDSVISKNAYSAFQGTDLKEQLLRLGVDTVVICGAMTNLCCETTARSAFDSNFNVIFLEDGNATSSVEMHRATLMNLKFGFATIQTCEDFIATL